MNFPRPSLERPSLTSMRRPSFRTSIGRHSFQTIYTRGLSSISSSVRSRLGSFMPGTRFIRPSFVGFRQNTPPPTVLPERYETTPPSSDRFFDRYRMNTPPPNDLRSSINPLFKKDYTQARKVSDPKSETDFDIDEILNSEPRVLRPLHEYNLQGVEFDLDMSDVPPRRRTGEDEGSFSSFLDAYI
mmetsp:Transcript_9266/g.10574  ORF Transcript_9266/g.10574 Transcript_9266/m.10574 type:complete len:186 (-) Transcript_9266:317-874(-)